MTETVTGSPTAAGGASAPASAAESARPPARAAASAASGSAPAAAVGNMASSSLGSAGIGATRSDTPAQVAHVQPAAAQPAAVGRTPAAAPLPDVFERSRRRWRRLLDQVGAIVLSLALAVVIWLIAVSQANPLVTQDFGERITITVRGLDQQLQPVQDLGTETVRVNVRAPRAAWDDLNAGDFNATVDLATYGAGTHDIPIGVTVNDPRVTVLSVSPPSLLIQLDPLATRTLPVTVQIMDAPAFGYDSQTPLVDPPTITVSGPATQVDLVDQLVAPVFLLSAKSQVERTVDVRPINRQNQVVTGVDLSNQFATVVVPVEQWPGRKEVAVRLNLVGQPAAGYRLSTVRSEPSTVVLQGIAEVLATVPGYIETEPLSIEGATTELRTRLNLVVPPGVTVFDGSTVQAVISITPIEGGTTVRVQPIVQGLAPIYEATVSPESMDVILSGPVPLLESLNPDDMFVILDLTGLLPGTHVVTPRVVLPDGIRQEGVLPETVEVVISSILPPTEEPDVPSSEVPAVRPDGTPLAPADELPLESTPEPAPPEGIETRTPVSTTTPGASTPTTTAPTATPTLTSRTP